MSEYDDGDGFIHSSPRKDFKSQRNLRTLTIKHLLNTNIESIPYKLDNTDISNVLLIGFIENSKEAKGSGRIFTLNDHTAKVRCLFWAYNSYDGEKMGLLEDTNIIRAVGVVKSNNNDINVQLTFFEIVRDPNYLTYHFLQSCYQYLFFNNLLKREIKKKKSVNPAEIGFSNLQKDILATFRKNQDENGMHVDTIVRMLSNQYEENELRDCIDSLINDCHLYAVDDNCYRTTFN